MMFGFWPSLLLWATVGVIGAVAIVVIVPWLVAKPLGGDAQDRVAQWYLWAAQTLIGRAGVIVRDEEFDLVRKSYDDAYDADKDTNGDQPRRHYDPLKVLGRLQNRIFGFALSDHDLWVSPLAAEIGGKAWQLQQEDELGRELRRTEDGYQKLFKDGIPISATPQLVDLTDARHLVQGSSRPETSEDAEELAKTSQEPFTETVSPVQALLIVGGLIGGFAVAAFMGDGATAGPPMPNTTTVSLLPLVGLGSRRIRTVLAGLLGVAVGVAGPVATWWIYGPVFAAAMIVVEAAVVIGIPVTMWLRGRDERVDESADTSEADGSEEGGDTSEGDGSGQDGGGRRIGALVGGAVLLSTAIFPAIAWISYGPLFAVVTWAMTVLTAGAIPFAIWVIGPGLPALIASPIAKISWILAMLAVGGRGVIVERDDRTLEFRQLRDAPPDAETRFWARLSDGTRLPVSGEEGDLRRFAWGELGVVAEKSARNMSHICLDNETLQQARTDGGTRVQSSSRRGGYVPVINTGSTGDWIVTLPHLESWTRGAAQAQSVQQGRQRGLTDHGGNQGLGQWAFLMLLIAAPVVGLLIGVFAA